MVNKAFEFENVEVRIVPRESIDGRTFYVSRDGAKGCNVMPDGSVKNCNATPVTCPNSKYNGRRKQHYLQFKDVFGHHRPILAAHAVWLAWSGQSLPPNHQIHHLTGIVTDNRLDNLLCVAAKTEHRIADMRQHALRKLVPDSNLYVCSYNLLRALQDPRTMPVEDFEHALDVFRFLNEQVPIHWQTFKEVDYLRWFYMPFEEFKAEMIKGLGKLVGPEQMMKESFYDKD